MKNIKSPTVVLFRRQTEQDIPFHHEMKEIESIDV